MKTAAATPRATSALRLTIGLVVAIGSLVVLVWGPTARWLGRLMSASNPLNPLPLSAVGAGAVMMLLGWLIYGLSFWLFIQGILPDARISFVTASGVFTLSYILGTLALFAPGGIGVRELVLISLLTPHLGSGGAVATSVGSRLLLTIGEFGAALIAVALARTAPSSEPRPE